MEYLLIGLAVIVVAAIAIFIRSSRRTYIQHTGARCGAAHARASWKVGRLASCRGWLG